MYTMLIRRYKHKKFELVDISAGTWLHSCRGQGHWL